MEPKTNNKSELDAGELAQSVSFQEVSSVATGWMMDFTFLTLCRHFKEDKFKEFNDAVTVFEAICQSTALKGDIYSEKMLICAFLSRVMHGKQLDVPFEEDKRVMPLMSAAKIWSKLEDSVEEESVFKHITILLFVQSVAVCLEKGQRSSASLALKWFDKTYELPQKLSDKLKNIVEKSDTYHQIIMSFSFNHLLESIQSYLDVYLKKNPSDDLLKEATARALSSQSLKGLKDKVQESAHVETTNEPVNHDTKTAESIRFLRTVMLYFTALFVMLVSETISFLALLTLLRTKRKLLPTKITDMWKPESAKKPCLSIRRLSNSELVQTISEKSKNSTEIHKKRKPHQKWTPELDKFLKEGVGEHGVGKWSRILMDYDFEGRTATMLKDRWRILIKANLVG